MKCPRITDGLNSSRDNLSRTENQVYENIVQLVLWYNVINYRSLFFTWQFDD